MVHFFLYDYRFERVWKNPDSDIEKLSRYRAVLSPDFSMYLEMAPVMQLYNVFRNRWCGAYWASKGIRVIPSVNWGDESMKQITTAEINIRIPMITKSIGIRLMNIPCRGHLSITPVAHLSLSNM